MRIDEAALRRIIAEVLQQMNSHTVYSPAATGYIVLPDSWSAACSRYYERLGERITQGLVTIIPPLAEEGMIRQCLAFAGYRGEVLRKTAKDNMPSLPYLSVFPDAPRDFIAKVALCIGDTYQTRWARRAIEEGQRIQIVQTGLEPLTGREPVAYAQRIKGYYQDLESFGIEFVSDDFITVRDKWEPIREHTGGLRKIRVYTESDIEQFQQAGRIELYPGDRITPLALDKANSLGIHVIG